MTDARNSHRLARQFRQVAVTDCVCWVAVSVAAVWSVVAGQDLSVEVNAVLALLLQPVNAALNPCLWLVGRSMEDHRLLQEMKLLQVLQQRLMRQQKRDRRRASHGN
jgi:hypothetical protein